MKIFINSLFANPPPCPPDIAMREHLQRFQCQPWYIKLWRYRHYLPIPFRAVKWWISDHIHKDGRKEPFGRFWSLAIGLAQRPMKWYYTMFEIFQKRIY